MASIERLIHLCEGDSELLGGIQELAQYRKNVKETKEKIIKNDRSYTQKQIEIWDKVYEEIARNG
jgi:hypothetical protein